MRARYNGNEVLMVNFATGLFNYITSSRCVLSGRGLDKLEWVDIKLPEPKHHFRSEYQKSKKVTQ